MRLYTEIYGQHFVHVTIIFNDEYFRLGLRDARPC